MNILKEKELRTVVHFASPYPTYVAQVNSCHLGLQVEISSEGICDFHLCYLILTCTGTYIQYGPKIYLVDCFQWSFSRLFTTIYRKIGQEDIGNLRNHIWLIITYHIFRAWVINISISHFYPALGPGVCLNTHLLFFFRRYLKNGGALAHQVIHPCCTRCENFRPRSLNVRSLSSVNRSSRVTSPQKNFECSS